MRIAILFIFCTGSLFVNTAKSQVVDQWADSTRLTTTWLKIQKDPYAKINIFEVLNDTTTTAGNVVYIALEDDTSSGRRSIIRGQESIYISGLGVTHVFIRASFGSLPVRYRYH